MCQLLRSFNKGAQNMRGAGPKIPEMVDQNQTTIEPIEEDTSANFSRRIRQEKHNQFLARQKRRKEKQAVEIPDHIREMDYEELLYSKYLAYDPLHRKAYNTMLRMKADKVQLAETEKLSTRRMKMRRAIKAGRVRKFGSDKSEKKFKYGNNARDTQMRDTTTVYVTQSSHGEMALDEATSATGRENVQEIAPTNSAISSGKNGESVDVGGAAKATLAKFFERPINIYDDSWVVGSDVRVQFNPWDLWSTDPTIRAKLSNYAYFKGTCHIRISITGTPFHYGRVMFSYQPFPSANDVLTTYSTLYSSTDPGPFLIADSYNGYLSQAPGVTYVDIKENEPCEMEFPFIHPKARARLFNYNNNVIAAADSYTDLAAMGSVYVHSLQPIAVANEDYASTVSVNVYCWMTDVELGTVTGTDTIITPQTHYVTQARKRGGNNRVERKAENIIEEAQDIEDATGEGDSSPQDWYAKKVSGKPMYDSTQSWGQRISGAVDKAGTYDEHDEPGPVSTIASAVAKVGDTLADIPYIGGFAKATSTVAKGVGKVAKWFGFAKPLVLDKQILTKRETYANGALLTGFDTAKKLTCDPKQELALRTDLGGLEMDQMAVNTITARESFLTYFTWSDSDVAMTDTLYRIAVSPMLHTKFGTPGNYTMVQPTALEFAARPFRYWRGSITYRFEFVCSKFHRGKVIIRYEPNSSQSTLIASGDAKLNQMNTLIVDLQETQNIDITIGWTHDRAFCRTLGDTVNDQALRHGTAVDITSFNTEENIGWIDVRPFNELVQPTDDANVPVNIYVRSNDISFAVPSQEFIETERKYLVTQSHTVTTSVNLNQVENNEDNVFLDHFGEKVISFRSLMKRYTTQGLYNNNIGSVGKRQWIYNFNLYPTSFSHFEAGVAGNYDDPLAKPTLYEYLRYGYLGVRGGYRHRLKMMGAMYYENGDTATVSNVLGSLDWYQPTFSDTAVNIANIAAENSLDGTVTIVPASEGTVEVELPYYSLNLFEFAFSAERGFDQFGGDIMAYDTSTASLVVHGNSKSNSLDAFLNDVSASGEDFSFIRFQGAPLHSLTTQSKIVYVPNLNDLETWNF